MEQQELDFHLLATMRPKVYVPRQHPLARQDEGIDGRPGSLCLQPLFSGNRQFPRPLLLRGACGEYRRKKTITLTDEMADASIGMEMNTYTIGSGMSGENLLEKITPS